MLHIHTFDARAGGNVHLQGAGPPARRRGDRAAVCEAGDGGRWRCTIRTASPRRCSRCITLRVRRGCSCRTCARSGTPRGGDAARPLTELGGGGARTVLIAAFDAGGSPRGSPDSRRRAEVLRSTDAAARGAADQPAPLPRPAELRDQLRLLPRRGRAVTRLVTANYWAGYGARRGPAVAAAVRSRRRGAGDVGGEVPAGPGGIAIDSREVRARFGLPAVHRAVVHPRVGAAGHDVVKYALDTYASRRRRQPVLHARRQCLAVRPLRRPAGAGRRTSGWCCGCRTATPRRSRPARSRSTAWAPSGQWRWIARSAPFASVALDVGATAAGRALAGADGAARRAACGAAALRGGARRADAHRACECRARRSAPGPGDPHTAGAAGARLSAAVAGAAARRFRTHGAADADGGDAGNAAGAARCVRRDGRKRRRAVPRAAAGAITRSRSRTNAGGGGRPCRAGLRFPRRRRGGRLAARAVPLRAPRSPARGAKAASARTSSTR